MPKIHFKQSRVWAQIFDSYKSSNLRLVVCLLDLGYIVSLGALVVVKWLAELAVDREVLGSIPALFKLLLKNLVSVTTHIEKNGS